jgi:hypothetical protein
MLKVLMMGVTLTLLMGCGGLMDSKAKSTIGGTTVEYDGTSTNPEGSIRENGIFLQRAVAAENERDLVKAGRMPYRPGGCFGGRCTRQYGAFTAPPLPNGPTERMNAETDEREARGTAGGEEPSNDSAAELEAMRQEAETARREAAEAREKAKRAEADKQEALDALEATVTAVGGAQ